MKPVLAIVGAGFSGTLLALDALRRSPAVTTVVLAERAAASAMAAPTPPAIRTICSTFPPAG
jgi:2-polyprenyl-6-methoxyphenol hydroxylase-like FAD-dependent oxidoreductase